MFVSVSDDALCAFDFQQTGNEQIAMDTANANENFRNDTIILCESCQKVMLSLFDKLSLM